MMHATDVFRIAAWGGGGGGRGWNFPLFTDSPLSFAETLILFFYVGKLAGTGTFSQSNNIIAFHNGFQRCNDCSLCQVPKAC